MKEPNSIWKCGECGIILESLHDCSGYECCVPACCGKTLTRVVENHSDGAGEKHLPTAEADGAHLKVKVGSVPHPMTEAHYIMWIEVIDGGSVYRRYLNPSDPPEAVFPVQYRSGLILREYCNLHGLWAAKIE